jgi:hypothetical protein
VFAWPKHRQGVFARPEHLVGAFAWPKHRQEVLVRPEHLVGAFVWPVPRQGVFVRPEHLLGEFVLPRHLLGSFVLPRHPVGTLVLMYFLPPGSQSGILSSQVKTYQSLGVEHWKSSHPTWRAICFGYFQNKA